MSNKIKKKKEEIVKKTKTNPVLNKIYEILLYLFSYTVTLLILQIFFKSIKIAEPKILFAILSVIIIYVLNQVVRPILVTITMPITGITFGLFYFVINTFLLKITDLVMFDKLDFTNIWVLFLISILLSILRFVIEDVILKPLIKRVVK